MGLCEGLLVKGVCVRCGHDWGAGFTGECAVIQIVRFMQESAPKPSLGWICTRCGASHSPYKQTCGCPSPRPTQTGYKSYVHQLPATDGG